MKKAACISKQGKNTRQLWFIRRSRHVMNKNTRLQYFFKERYFLEDDLTNIFGV